MQNEGSMNPLRPYEKKDTLKQFLDHDRHVLRFYCVWDDRESNSFGDMRQVTWIEHCDVKYSRVPCAGLELQWLDETVCRWFEWRCEDFVSGFVSLHNDCFRNFCLKNIQVARFQTASLAEELLYVYVRVLLPSIVGIFSPKKNDINVLLSAVCTE